MIIPSLFGNDCSGGGNLDYEELDVSSYFLSGFGTIVAKLVRWGRISCIAIRLDGNTSETVPAYDRMQNVIYQSVEVGEENLDIIKKMSAKTVDLTHGMSGGSGAWFASGQTRYYRSQIHRSQLYMDSPINGTSSYPDIMTLHADFENISDTNYTGVINIYGSIMFINRYEE